MISSSRYRRRSRRRRSSRRRRPSRRPRSSRLGCQVGASRRACAAETPSSPPGRRRPLATTRGRARRRRRVTHPRPTSAHQGTEAAHRRRGGIGPRRGARPREAPAQATAPASSLDMTVPAIDLVTFVAAAGAAAAVTWLVAGWRRIGSVVSTLALAGAVGLAWMLEPDGSLAVGFGRSCMDPTCGCGWSRPPPACSDSTWSGWPQGIGPARRPWPCSRSPRWPSPSRWTTRRRHCSC